MSVGWKTIGYVVSELLDEVHNVMDNGRIISVEFAWISYVTDWRSGPAYFAGIIIMGREEG